MTNEEFLNRPMTAARVNNSLFGLFCENYSDLELRANYELAMEVYDAIEMGEREKEIESSVRANGDNTLRGLPGNVCPLVRASA